MNTNILYHEATFGNQLADKAKETGHSTAKDAARVAAEAQTKLLVIGHFSARYTNLHLLLKEAREGFYPTWLAQELRPIFTDPSHERGVVEPKIDLIDLTKNKPQSGSANYRASRSKGGRSSGNRHGGNRPGSKNFRPRKSNDSAFSGNRGRYGSSNYEDRGNRYRKNDEGSYRSNNRGTRDYNNSDRNNMYDDSKVNKSITPRTGYDDFNRF